jgi:hypothetical protein
VLEGVLDGLKVEVGVVEEVVDLVVGEGQDAEGAAEV